MTYGFWLDRAATSLEAAATSAPTAGAVDHPDAVAALTARRAVYAGVERLRELMVGLDEEAIPAFRQFATDLRAVMSAGRAGTPEDVNRMLRLVASLAKEGESRLWPPPRPGHGVARDLAAAASALHTAGDVLASHLEPTGQPQSPVGAAIRHGDGVAGALGDLSLMAARACRVDQELNRWLNRRPSDGKRIQAIHAGELRSIAILSAPAVARWLERMGAKAQPSVLRHLQPAAPGDASTLPAAKIRDVFVVVQSVAARMYQHPDQVTMVDIADACLLGSRLADLEAAVGRTTHSRDSPEAVNTLAAAEATAVAWWETARLAGELGAQPGADYPMRPAVAASAKLLRTLAGQTIRGTQAGLVHTAARWLPGLAASVRFALHQGIEQRHLLIYTLALERSGDRLVRRTTPRWEVANSLDGPAGTLSERLHALATGKHGQDATGQLLAGSVAAIASQLDTVRSGRAANSARMRGHRPPVPPPSPDRRVGPYR